MSSNQGFTAKTARDTNDIKLTNLLSLGINYSNDFDNLNISASSTAEYAKPQTKNGIARNELFSYDFAIPRTSTCSAIYGRFKGGLLFLKVMFMVAATSSATHHWHCRG